VPYPSLAVRVAGHKCRQRHDQSQPEHWTNRWRMQVKFAERDGFGEGSQRIAWRTLCPGSYLARMVFSKTLLKFIWKSVPIDITGDMPQELGTILVQTLAASGQCVCNRAIGAIVHLCPKNKDFPRFLSVRATRPVGTPSRLRAWLPLLAVQVQVLSPAPYSRRT